MSVALYKLLINIIGFYIFILFAYVVMSWLIAFNVVNLRNPVAAQIAGALEALTAPVLNPIRKIIPPIGGLDLSVIVLIFGLWFIQDLLAGMMLQAI